MSRHAIDHLGETCPSCGTHHRVLGWDDRPMTVSAVKSLRQSDSVFFAAPVSEMDPEFAGVSASEDVTEDVVLSTASETLHVARYEDVGWVVEQEIEHEDSEEPEDVGTDLWMEMSRRFAHVLEKAADEVDW